MSIFAKNIPATKFLQKYCEFVKKGIHAGDEFLTFKRIAPCH